MPDGFTLVERARVQRYRLLVLGYLKSTYKKGENGILHAFCSLLLELATDDTAIMKIRPLSMYEIAKKNWVSLHKTNTFCLFDRNLGAVRNKPVFLTTSVVDRV